MRAPGFGAVAFSGSATDGTLGLEVIKAEGGITFAQDESAQHNSMPMSAVASGCVDFVLLPEGIAREIARHPYVAMKDPQEIDAEAPGHGSIAEIVRGAMGVNFTHYKAATLQRRMQHRIMVYKIETLAEYEAHLSATPGEVEALYQDVFIGVTSFFRNPEAAGRARARSRYGSGHWAGRRARRLIRWRCFAECAEAAKSTAQLQMFASDLNASGIEKARAGLYPRKVAHDVSPHRRRRFFTEVDGGYRVSKGIRERIVFSQQNVLTDPPFSRVDFISCRNLLLYLEPVLQQQVMPLLHNALKPAGRLWLGSSESVGSSRALFEVEDARRVGPAPRHRSPTSDRYRAAPFSHTPAGARGRRRRPC